MSQAISIVKPGTNQANSTGTKPSKLNPLNAQPFIPNQQSPGRTQLDTQPPPGLLHPQPGPYTPIEYDYSHPHPHPHGLHLVQPNGGVGYYHPPNLKLDHHLYQHHQHSNNNNNHPTFFLSPNLHLHLSNQIEAIESTTPASSTSADPSTPTSVANYNQLVLLDKPTHQLGPDHSSSSSMGGYRSILYKAWNHLGECVALRRIAGFRVTAEKQITSVDNWTRLKHPGLVHLHEAFTTREFGDYSVVFVYDFHPLGVTLYNAHLSPLASLPPNPWATNNNNTNSNSNNNTSNSRSRSNPANSNSTGPAGLSERLVWSYLIQLSSAIKTIHHSALAVRNLEPNRVIITSKNRLRIAGCGIMDVINYDQTGQSHYQQDDLLALGKLMVALGCGASSAVHNLPNSIDHIARVYSPELKNVILYLLSKPNPRKTIDEVLALAGPRVLDELNSSLVAEDKQEYQLLRQVENGRLVRLLAKFGFINERPEFDHDPRWAETGDRYIIKLFRDYVFHQVDEAGRPLTDLSHVITALNKLDGGSDEKLMLISRDEQSVIIVSYKEVKNCIEAAFADLSR